MASTTPAGVATPGAPRRRITRKRVILASVLLIAIAGGTYGVRLALSLASITHQNPFAAINDVIRGKGDSAIQKQIDANQRINIAIYGYGGPPHDGPYLTDSILIASLQPMKGAPPQVAEVSIPRDWFVPIQVNGKVIEQARVNQAFADGVTGTARLPPSTDSGAQVAAATLGKVLGIHIDHFVGVDFSAFQAGVDAVGGVDIDVPNTFSDYQYPRGECGTDGSGDCSYKTVHFDAGTQHMDGATALIFARSRHSPDANEGTDFARSHRQQLVLQALKQKVVSIGGISHLPDLLNALSDHIATDLKIGDAEALYDLVKGVDRDKINRVSLDDTNFLYECGYPATCPASYLYAHDTTYQSIAAFMAHVMPDPAALAEHAPVTVNDGSGTGLGASTRWGGLLKAIGFASVDGGQTQSQATTQVIDQSGGRYPKTAQWLADYYGVAAEPASPGSSPAASAGGDGAGVLVVLGRDEERSFNRSSDSGLGSAGADTASPSASSSPTATPSRPRSQTPSPKPSASPSHSASPSPSATPTPSPTPPSPSGSVPPTASPT